MCLRQQFPWKRSNLAFRHCGLSDRCLLFWRSLLQTAEDCFTVDTCASARGACTLLCALNCVLACEICIYRGTEIHTETIRASKAQSIAPKGSTGLVNKPVKVSLNLNSRSQMERKSGFRAFRASKRDLSVFPLLHAGAEKASAVFRCLELFHLQPAHKKRFCAN